MKIKEAFNQGVQQGWDNPRKNSFAYKLGGFIRRYWWLVLLVLLAFATRCGAQTANDSFRIDTLGVIARPLGELEREINERYRDCKHERLILSQFKLKIYVDCMDCDRTIREANTLDIQELCKHDKGSYYAADSVQQRCKICHRYKTFYGWCNREEFERREQLEMQQWEWRRER